MSGPFAEDPIVIFVQNAAGEVTAIRRETDPADRDDPDEAEPVDVDGTPAPP